LTTQWKNKIKGEVQAQTSCTTVFTMESIKLIKDQHEEHKEGCMHVYNIMRELKPLKVVAKKYLQWHGQNIIMHWYSQ
jgi:peptide deformylase